MTCDATTRRASPSSLSGEATMGLSQTDATCVRLWLRGVVAAALITCSVGAAHAQCVGDCSNDGMVAINELIIGVNIALERQPVSACPAFQNSQGRVDISQLIKGVNNALGGCPATPTATATGEEIATSTATAIPTGTSTATLT